VVRKAETSRSESGQTSVETVLIIGAIALACLVAMIFLRGGISNIFDSIVDPNGPPPSAPFVPPAEVVLPSRVEDCLDGGWHNYPQFVDEQSCVEFVTSGGG
jgi:Flp pilus assembly pilin Flp